MPGRKPKPAYMFDQPGDKSNKSKKVKKLLQEHTVKIGGKDFHAPASVKSNKVAKDKWVEIMKLYATTDLDIVTSADIGLLEQYSLTYAEYKQLIDAKMTAVARYPNDPIASASLIHDLRLETKINQKLGLLLRMSEQLFLTPLSKSRAIPRTAKKNPKKEAMKKDGFNL